MRYRIVTQFNGYPETPSAAFDDYGEACDAWREELLNAQHSANTAMATLIFILRDTLSGKDILRLDLPPMLIFPDPGRALNAREK